MRTLVIGDIHGGLRSLQQVLERSKYDPMKDRLICLGDYVDGWSESSEVIEFLLEIQTNASFSSVSPNMTVFIRGNHDKWCQDWLLMGQAPLIWVQQGGQSTLDSYIGTGHLTKDSHRQFFKNLRNFYVDEQNRGFVHGGFHSRKGLGHEVYESDYYWDRDLWQLVTMLHGKEEEARIPQSQRYQKHKEIFIGHTATPNWNCKPHYPEYENPLQESKNGPITVPMNRCNVWNMDTGGGFAGKLSIMDIDTKEVWQSDWMKELYPNEKGR